MIYLLEILMVQTFAWMLAYVVHNEMSNMQTFDILYIVLYQIVDY